MIRSRIFNWFVIDWLKFLKTLNSQREFRLYRMNHRYCDHLLSQKFSSKLGTPRIDSNKTSFCLWRIPHGYPGTCKISQHVRIKFRRLQRPVHGWVLQLSWILSLAAAAAATAAALFCFPALSLEYAYGRNMDVNCTYGRVPFSETGFIIGDFG